MEETGFTGFLCPACETEIEASLDMCGLDTECPACGALIKVPAPELSPDGIVRHTADEDAKSRTQAFKSRTIRIELDGL